MKYECEVCGFVGDEYYKIEDSGEILNVCKACFDGYSKRNGIEFELEKPVKTEEEIEREALEVFKKIKRRSRKKGHVQVNSHLDSEYSQITDNTKECDSVSDGIDIQDNDSLLNNALLDEQLEEEYRGLHPNIKDSILERIGLDEFDIGDIRSETALLKLLDLNLNEHTTEEVFVRVEDDTSKSIDSPVLHRAEVFIGEDKDLVETDACCKEINVSTPLNIDEAISVADTQIMPANVVANSKNSIGSTCNSNEDDNNHSNNFDINAIVDKTNINSDLKVETIDNSIEEQFDGTEEQESIVVNQTITTKTSIDSNVEIDVNEDSIEEQFDGTEVIKVVSMDNNDSIVNESDFIDNDEIVKSNCEEQFNNTEVTINVTITKENVTNNNVESNAIKSDIEEQLQDIESINLNVEGIESIVGQSLTDCSDNNNNATLIINSNKNTLDSIRLDRTITNNNETLQDISKVNDKVIGHYKKRASIAKKIAKIYGLCVLSFATLLSAIIIIYYIVEGFDSTVYVAISSAMAIGMSFGISLIIRRVYESLVCSYYVRIHQRRIALCRVTGAYYIKSYSKYPITYANNNIMFVLSMILPLAFSIACFVLGYFWVFSEIFTVDIVPSWVVYPIFVAINQIVHFIVLNLCMTVLERTQRTLDESDCNDFFIQQGIS